ncbi:MAG: hypothetical protein KUG57_09130 [Ilumatobacteraceae bacterium]|nr:hypothetical protein [Ilumatobacteraceae bacterium]
MTTTIDNTSTPSPRVAAPLLTIAAVGGAVAVAIGVYGNVHDPTGQAITTFGFPRVLPMKAWFATGAAFLGILQLLSALWMWGRLPKAGSSPAWLPPAHRWLGTAAFLLTLPVAYHCLWSLGFQDTNGRILAHSILGCAFYGAFTTKMLALRSDRLPGWTLPAAGGTLVAILTVIWLTSSLWFFTTIGFPGV